MMPVVPSAKRLNGFSIDSLMGKDRGRESASSGETRGRSPVSSPRDPPPAVSIGGAGSSFHPVHPGSSFLNGVKSMYGSSELSPPGHYPHPGAIAAGEGGLPAALAGLPHAALPGALPHALHGLHHALHGHPGLTPHPLLLGAQRDLFPLHPWLLSRHGGFLNHRLAGPEGLLLQPFRKPKRIRTAFSPSQLLRLEHAFEKNHYVVGQERKELAQNLSLTETQVKVWFQNRRTKYKRMKAEEAEGQGKPGEGHPGSGPPSPASPLSPGMEEEDDDDMELDVVQGMSDHEDDDDEEEAEARARLLAARNGLLDTPQPPEPPHPVPPSPFPQQTPPSPRSTSPPPSPPSPCPLDGQTIRSTHHLNRWRVDTNQV